MTKRPIRITNRLDLTTLKAFVHRTMPPWAFADYLEDNGVQLPGRVYELLRSEVNPAH